MVPSGSDSHNQSRRPTLQDVADAVGISRSAASKALRDHPRISATKRGEAQRVARELGYRPDPLLSGLARRRWGQQTDPQGAHIAYLLTIAPGVTPDELTWQTAVEAATSLGYRVTRYYVVEYPKVEALVRTLEAHNVVGVICVRVYIRDFIDNFPWNQFPSVAIQLGDFVPQTDVVAIDRSAAVRMVLDQIVGMGYRSPGLVIPPSRDGEVADRAIRETFVGSIAWEGMTRARKRVLIADAADHEAISAWISELKIDCVIGYGDEYGGALRKLPSRQRPGFASLNRSSGQTGAAYAGVDCGYPQAARRAVALLDSAIRTSQWPGTGRSAISFVQPRWVPGKSLPSRTK